MRLGDRGLNLKVSPYRFLLFLLSSWYYSGSIRKLWQYSLDDNSMPLRKDHWMLYIAPGGCNLFQSHPVQSNHTEVFYCVFFELLMANELTVVPRTVPLCLCSVRWHPVNKLRARGWRLKYTNTHRQRDRDAGHPWIPQECTLYCVQGQII